MTIFLQSLLHFEYVELKPKINFNKGLQQTIMWYLNNENFLKKISKKDYEKRLGLKLWSKKVLY